MESTSSSVAAYLAEHPRIVGLLFTAILLLSRAGVVVAGSGSTTNGP